MVQRSSLRFTVGFDPFRSCNSKQHVASLVLGIAIWFAAFTVTARFVSGDLAREITIASVAASGTTAAYFSALFARAIGAPLWDLIAPAAITVGVPRTAYVVLAGSRAAESGSVRLFYEGGDLGLEAFAVSIALPFVAVVLTYASSADPRRWEREHMPDGFSLIGLADYVAETEDRPESVETNAATLLLVLAASALLAAATATVAGLRLDAGDLSGPVLVAALVLYAKFG